MAGYTRQSSSNIQPGEIVKSGPVNNEFNAIRDTFALATGHKHDGSSTEGGYVPLIADSDALNKVVIDTSNNRIGFFSEVSSAAVEQIRIQDGAIVPVTDNDIDLGGSSTKFKNLYVNGIASIGSISLSGGTIDGTVIGGTTAAAGTFSSLVATTADINAGTIDNAVIGGSTASSGSFTTIAASSNATVGGTLGVTGNVTMGGTLAVTGTTALTGTATITSADINSGAMDNTTIGNTTAAAGTFTDLTSTGTSTHATVDINGGAIDGVTIGAASAGAGTFTDLASTGTSTLATVDIGGGAMDGTIIGASSAAAGSFTTVSTTGQATLATVDIGGGAIDGAIIGASSAAAITGTTITGTSLVGTVTGDVTGDLTGDVTGDVTGDLTGNVTAGSGSSTFNNVTVNGTLDVTGTTIANVTDPSNAQDAATKNYVDTEVAALVDSAPGTLDTLNELAAAIGDDANFSTTITNSIATKLPLAGGTMSGAIAMGTSKITGLGDPTANQDAATKKYTTDTFLPLAGGTITGAIDMGSNKITASYTPSANTDLATKIYVDNIAGSGTAASASATAAASSATAAASSATAAASSATGAASSATSAASSLDSFDDRYLGAKSSAPTVDNDGDALIIGALYFNSTTDIMNVYGSGGWQAAGSSVNGTSSRNTYTATAGQTTFAATYDTGFVDVYLNGVKLLAGTDFTATNNTSVVLASGAAVNDIVDIVAYGTFSLSTHYTKTEADALLAAKQPYATIAVTVVNSGGNKYALDGTVQQLALLTPSVTYRFDQSDSSNSGHPLLLSTTSNGTHGGGSAFTTGVTAVGTPGSAGAYTEVKLEQDAPDTLYYYCTNHSGMGGEVDVNAKLPLSGGTLTGGLTGTTATFTGDLTVDTNTLKVDSSNNRVSVGHTSPTSPLDVRISGAAGSIAEFHNTSGFGVDIGSDSDSVAYISSGYTQALAFKTNAGSGQVERLRITSDGKVGIGTSSPDELLHIHGTTQSYIKLTDDDSGEGATDGALFAFDGSSATQYIWNYENGPTVFATNSTERMRIDASGDILAKTADARIGSDVGSIEYGTSTDNSVRFYSNNSERMRITSGGNVGIGTSSPNVTLTLSDGTDEFDFGVTTNALMIKTVTSDGSDDQRIILDAGNGGQSSARGAYVALSGNEASSNAGQAIYQMGNVSGASHEFRKAGGTHAASIDASGNLLVGTTNNSPATNNVAGSSHGSLGNIQASVDGNPCLFVNRKSNDGDIISFRKDGSAVGSIGTDNTVTYIMLYPSTGLRGGGSSIVPATTGGATTDNTKDLGASSIRWDDIYATNGTIQTSDRNEKQDIEELTDAEQRVAVAAKGLLRKFRWKDAVAEKGDKARTHFGIIAQDLQAAFEAEGLDAGDYAMFISSTWTDEETGEERTRMGVRYSELLAFIIAAI